MGCRGFEPATTLDCPVMGGLCQSVILKSYLRGRRCKFAKESECCVQLTGYWGGGGVLSVRWPKSKDRGKMRYLPTGCVMALSVGQHCGLRVFIFLNANEGSHLKFGVAIVAYRVPSVCRDFQHQTTMWFACFMSRSPNEESSN